jgi:hypothetical protein
VEQREHHADHTGMLPNARNTKVVPSSPTRMYLKTFFCVRVAVYVVVTLRRADLSLKETYQISLTLVAILKKIFSCV